MASCEPGLPRCPQCDGPMEQNAWDEQWLDDYTFHQRTRFYCDRCDHGWWYTMKYKLTECERMNYDEHGNPLN